MAAASQERTGAVESTSTWRVTDRIAYYLCWACGIALCLIAFGILGYMTYRGLQFLSLDLITQRPTAEFPTFCTIHEPSSSMPNP